MAAKQNMIKFDKANKAQLMGRVGHSRTGACPSKTGICYCPKKSKAR